MLIGRTATYNGRPNRPQRWTETYRRPDGSTVTLQFFRFHHTNRVDRVTVNVQQPAHYYTQPTGRRQ